MNYKIEEIEKVNEGWKVTYLYWKACFCGRKREVTVLDQEKRPTQKDLVYSLKKL